MYENLIKKLNPAISNEDAATVVEWMRDNIYPTLDHLPVQSFSDALAECYVFGVI